MLVDREGHGREEIFPDVDVSRTVGWFTDLYPVRLDAEGKSPCKARELVKEQLRRLPDHGIGHGLLPYLNVETAPVLAAMPQPRSRSTISDVWKRMRGRWKAGAIRRCNWRLESR